MHKPAIEPTNTCYAVCVGINHYDDQNLSTLHCAENDAQAIYDLILRRGFPQDHCCLLLGQDATTDAVYDALKTFVLTKPKKNDLVIFYFAGHGVPIYPPDEEEGEEELVSDVFLATQDVNYTNISNERGLWLEYPLRLGNLRSNFFERARSKKVLFLLDSCHSGDFFGSSYRTVQPSTQQLVEQTLGHMSEGRMVLSSCMPQQVAYEDIQKGHGRFTYHLLQALNGQTREAVRRDGVMTVSSLFDYLSQVMPQNQRPVESGVKHGSFELWRFPEFDESNTSVPPLIEETHQEIQKQQQLRALFADHSGFTQDRKASFVGRQIELEEIRQRIAEKLSTGGYVTITGQAGQGKSSIITKLIDEYIEKNGEENVAYHFIPFNPGPDHQVGLLRNLMARLILKHNLPDFYVASDSRSALRDFFPKILSELASKEKREVIFVDGLDQIEEEFTGQRDLSFLPNNPPIGIVFVLGTRPDDTLRPLELLKPHHEYKLPNLSREDFDLILEHRNIKLPLHLVDQFYQMQQGNALYLDLVAQELSKGSITSPDDMPEHIARDPNNIFAVSIRRLRRQTSLWSRVIKPLLGLLLTAQDSLTLRTIRKLLEIDADELNIGLERLGGLVVRDGHQRCSLYHLQFRSYLREDPHLPDKDYVFAYDGEKLRHKRLADWCKQENLSLIWQDTHFDIVEQERRSYARKHYITHLYEAQEWQQLFLVLDEGSYGQAKIYKGSSISSYVQDLTLGQQAAIWKGWEQEEAVKLLPNLWRYTLLRCSLISRADDFSIERFETLVGQNRYKEAFDIADLLTDTTHKACVLLRIAYQLELQTSMAHEVLRVLIRCQEVIRAIKGKEKRANLYCEIGVAFFQIGQHERAEAVWEEAKNIILSMEDEKQKVEMQKNLGLAMIQIKQWKHAEATIECVKDIRTKIALFKKLGQALISDQKWEYTETIWSKIETTLGKIKNTKEQTEIRCDLGRLFAEAQQWERAEAVIQGIQESRQKAMALRALGEALTHAQREVQAESIWEQAEAAAQTIGQRERKIEILQELGEALTHAQQWERAEAVWTQVETQILAIKDKIKKSTALIKLCNIFIQAQLSNRAKTILETTEDITKTIKEDWEKASILYKLSTAFIQTHQWEHAKAIWMQAETTVSTLTRNLEKRTWALKELQRAYEELQQENQYISYDPGKDLEQKLEDMKKEVDTLDEAVKKVQKKRTEALSKQSEVYIQMQEWEQANAVIQTLEERRAKFTALQELGKACIQAQQWEQAEAAWIQAESILQHFDIYADRNDARYELTRQLIQIHQWRRAKTLITTSEESWEQVVALGKLGLALMQSQQWEQANTILRQAKTTAYTLKNSREQAIALRKLTTILIRCQQWELAHQVIDAIDESCSMSVDEPRSFLETDGDEQDEAAGLRKVMNRHLTQRYVKLTKRKDEALVSYTTIRNAETERLDRHLRFQYHPSHEHLNTISHHIPERNSEKVRALQELGTALTQAQQWKDAEVVWAKAEALIRARKESWERATMLCELGNVLIRTGQREKAKDLWADAKIAALSIENSSRKIIITKLHEHLTQNLLWEEAEDLVQSLEEGQTKTAVLDNLARALIQNHQWKRMENLIRSLKEGTTKVTLLSELSKALIQDQQWIRAEAAIFVIADDEERANTLIELWQSLHNTQQWEYAERLWPKVRDAIFNVQRTSSQLAILYKIINLLLHTNKLASVKEFYLSALKAMRNTYDYEKRVSEFRMLWSILSQAEQWEQIRTMAHGIKDRWERAVALEELGRARASACFLDQAEMLFAESEAVAQTIKSDRQRVEALRNLSKSLAQIGLWDKAESITLTIEYDWERDEALSELKKDQVKQTKQWEQATIVAQSMRGQSGDTLLQNISLTLVQAEQWAEAEWTARAIQDMEKKTEALYKLNQALIKAQQWERVRFVVDAMRMSCQKVNALGELGQALAETQQWEQAKAFWREAEMVANVLKLKEERAEALTELGRILSQTQQQRWAETVWAKTIDTARIIEDEEKREKALSKCCRILIQNQQWGMAASITRQLKRGEERASALCDLSEALAQVQRWEQAESIASAIKDKRRKYDAYLRLNKILAQAQRWQQAVRIAESIEVEEIRTYALQELCNILISSHQWKEALEVSYFITLLSKRVETLHLMENYLKFAKAYDSLLRLIQYSWLQAKTRADVLTLLPLANELIVHYPNIGTNFHETLPWVEQFLGGLKYFVE